MPQKSITKFTKKDLNATNITYKKKRQPKDRKKAVVARSYVTAYNKMLPSKEHRVNIDQGMSTDLIANFIYSQNISEIAQGTTLESRLGNTIHMSYLHIRGTIHSDSVKTKYLRMIIYQQKSTTAQVDTTNWSNLYLDGTFNAAAPNATERDGRLTLNKQLMTVFFDQSIAIKPEAEAGIVINRQIRLNKILPFFKDSAASINPLNGDVKVLLNLYDGDAAPSAILVHVSLGLRVFFKDYRKMNYKY